MWGRPGRREIRRPADLAPPRPALGRSGRDARLRTARNVAEAKSGFLVTRGNGGDEQGSVPPPRPPPRARGRQSLGAARRAAGLLPSLQRRQRIPFEKEVPFSPPPLNKDGLLKAFGGLATLTGGRRWNCEVLRAPWERYPGIVIKILSVRDLWPSSLSSEKLLEVRGTVNKLGAEASVWRR